MDVTNFIHKKILRFSRFFIIFASFVVTQTIHAGLILTFDKDHVVISPKDQAKSPKSTSSTLLVEIGKNYFSYEEKNQKHIYDFNRHRIITINMNDGIYLNDSIFVDIGFRGYEFQNRLHLGRVLKSASLKDNPMAITLSEHNLSLTAKDHQSEIKKKNKSKNVTFSWNNKELFKHEKNVIKIKSPYKDGFIRFLRYHLGGHPEILKDLQQLSGVPLSLTITSHNVQTKITTLRLKSHKYILDQLPNLAKFNNGKVDGALAPLLSNNTKFSEDALTSSVKVLLLKAMGAFKEKRYLDAMLTYLEYTLATGEKMPKQFNSQRESIVNDINVKTFLPVISPKSKDEALKAVKTLVTLRNNSKDRKHVLKIFEANIRSSLGMKKESIELFHDVLKSNPYITGAWKDLGELYFRNYNSRDAWRCWDTARKLNPQHHLLVPISEFESRLIKENPEFF